MLEEKEKAVAIMVKLPKSMCDLLDRAVQELGYYSRAELIREAIRMFLASRLKEEKAR